MQTIRKRLFRFKKMREMHLNQFNKILS
jgi:hypothetical protein